MSSDLPTGRRWEAEKEATLADPEDSSTLPADGLQPACGSSTVVVVLDGPIARADAPPLCERVRVLLQRSDGDVVCDVGALVAPDVGTVDALARLALTARRFGRRLRLRHACGDLRDLLVLVGLDGVVSFAATLPLEAEGQIEQREQPRGVQERVERDDPTG